MRRYPPLACCLMLVPCLVLALPGCAPPAFTELTLVGESYRAVDAALPHVIRFGVTDSGNFAYTLCTGDGDALEQRGVFEVPSRETLWLFPSYDAGLEDDWSATLARIHVSEWSGDRFVGEWLQWEPTTAGVGPTTPIPALAPRDGTYVLEPSSTATACPVPR